MEPYRPSIFFCYEKRRSDCRPSRKSPLPCRNPGLFFYKLKIRFKDVEEFAGFVAAHFDGIYKGNVAGHYQFVVSNERLQDLDLPAGSHRNTLAVEALLIKDRGVFDIITVFPRPSKFKKKKNLLSERAPSNHLQETPKNVSLTGQKQVYGNNIIHDSKNIQPVHASGYTLTTQKEGSSKRAF